MKFKSDKQRKAVMAKLRAKGISPRVAHIIATQPKVKKMSFKQLQKKGIFLRYQADSDKDGEVNVHDCRPLNPDKLGVLHDWTIKRLRKKEEKLESKREKEMKKLEDLKDTLKERTGVATKKADIKKVQLKQKQALINEIEKEKKATRELAEANKKAKEQLDRLTVTGKAKLIAKQAAKEGVVITGKGAVVAGKASLSALKAANNYLNRESTKRTIRNTSKRIWNTLFVEKKKDYLKLEKPPKQPKSMIS